MVPVLSPPGPAAAVLVLLLSLLVVLLLQPLLSVHVMLVVFVLLFFVMYNADSASTDIASASSLCISGRSPNQHHSKNNDIVCALVARVGSMRGEVPRRHI